MSDNDGNEKSENNFTDDPEVAAFLKNAIKEHMAEGAATGIDVRKNIIRGNATKISYEIEDHHLSELCHAAEDPSWHSWLHTAIGGTLSAAPTTAYFLYVVLFDRSNFTLNLPELFTTFFGIAAIAVGIVLWSIGRRKDRKTVADICSEIKKQPPLPSQFAP